MLYSLFAPLDSWNEGWQIEKLEHQRNQADVQWLLQLNDKKRSICLIEFPLIFTLFQSDVFKVLLQLCSSMKSPPWLIHEAAL